MVKWGDFWYTHDVMSTTSHTPKQGSGLPATLDMLKEAWASYLTCGRTLVRVQLLLALVGLVVAVVFASGAAVTAVVTHAVNDEARVLVTVLVAGIGILAFAAVAILSIIVGTAGGMAMLDVALHPKHSAREAWKRGLKEWKSFLWVKVLVSLIVVGAFIPLFVPGVIIIFLLAFAQVVYVDEGTKGMEALMRSRALVKGRLLAVIGRGVAFYFALNLPMFVLEALAGGAEQRAVLASGVFSLLNVVYAIAFMTPMLIILIVAMYRHLKALPRVDVAPAESLYKGLAVWGIFAPIFFAVLVGGSILAVVVSAFMNGGGYSQDGSYFGGYNGYGGGEAGMYNLDFGASNIEYAPEISGGDVIRFEN